MSLTGADVAEILRLLEGSSFDELELEMNGTKLVLRRGGAAPRATEAPAARTVPPSVAHAGAAATTAATATATAKMPMPAAAADTADGEAVTAPLLGTFYRAPKPGAPPFVEIGSEVQEDTVIAIIEVMKLMNSVRAGRSGRVTAILVGDGTLVEFGQPLVRIG